VIGRSRDFLKSAARATATVLAAPVIFCFLAMSRVIGRDRALQNATQGLSLLPGLAGQYIRRAFLTHALDHCHSSVIVEFGTLFSKTGARLEENVYIGPMCHIGLAHIGRDSLLAAAVHVPSGPRIHGIDDPDRPIRDQPAQAGIVKIGAGSWIGCGAIVMANIGEGTVVGAGSVVTRPLPDRVVAAGVPAIVKKSRMTTPGTGPSAGNLNLDRHRSPPDEPAITHQ
jgi:virginiamycin A acetyltransferase